MRILVTGANGQLGNEMQVLAKENPQHTYYFTDVQELDICDKQAVWAYIAEKRIVPKNVKVIPLCDWSKYKKICFQAINTCVLKTNMILY